MTYQWPEVHFTNGYIKPKYSNLSTRRRYSHKPYHDDGNFEDWANREEEGLTNKEEDWANWGMIGPTVGSTGPTGEEGISVQGGQISQQGEEGLGQQEAE